MGIPTKMEVSSFSLDNFSRKQFLFTSKIPNHASIIGAGHYSAKNVTQDLVTSGAVEVTNINIIFTVIFNHNTDHFILLCFDHFVHDCVCVCVCVCTFNSKVQSQISREWIGIRNWS